MSDYELTLAERLADPWRAKAACKKECDENSVMYAAFVDEKSHLTDYAKDICVTKCSQRAACLIDALLDPESEGIRAGFHFDSGRVTKETKREIRIAYPQLDPTIIRTKNAKRNARLNEQDTDEEV